MENIVVVKVGTNVVTQKGNRFDLNVMADVAENISAEMQNGSRIVLVSSGAVAAGRKVADRHSEIRLPDGVDPKSIVAKQYMAGIGQPELMATYKGLFLDAAPPRVASQVLVTRNNLANAAELKHILGPLHLYLQQGVVPIFNENDTVAIEELKFGDNDELAARIAKALKAKILVLLTDVDGVFDSDPRTDEHAKIIHELNGDELTPEFLAHMGNGKSENGTGGMISKVRAGMLAAEAGVPAVIANGKKDGVLPRLFQRMHGMHQQQIGTRILPRMVH